MRGDLRRTGTEVVAAIVAEVPDYRDAFAGPMGATIEQAVALALDGFLELAGRGIEPEGQQAIETVVEGAYRLGQGEVRSGRSMEALLAAYRVGARVAWRSLAGRGVAAGLPAEQVAAFAELVFAYIDQLSAASAAGHADELENSGRVRQRLLERLARQLLAGSPEATVEVAARRAEWSLPTTLTAVVLPTSQVRGVLPALSSATLVAVEDLPGVDDPEAAVLVVPDVHRAVLLRALEGRRAVVGPTVGWREVSGSYQRALRARALEVVGDTDAELPRLVLAADRQALADLRARALAPLAEVRESTADKLGETLRAWLLCRGRREQVAELLHVHPQTVRYRVGRLRELFGDDLDDPERVLELVLALG
ncbi:PucR family transcriptional regulator [Nocardioides mangrovicus]|uniref:PucR family transcriptional regulator n=2 Tax=Nocardioides mangrovicus TaxID=2478913 RepID=A0A3L8P4Z1_9ACTN|nr:PucR family transcriptional regulator [Nocardioides mangrovicus]